MVLLKDSLIKANKSNPEKPVGFFKVGKSFFKNNEINTDNDQDELQKTISGSITDKDGNPLPGASIIEKGTTNGTVTNFDGDFSLNVTNANATLVVSFIGFLSQEISVAGQDKITIALIEEIVLKAQKAKKDGLLSLEADLPKMREGFFKNGIYSTCNLDHPHFGIFITRGIVTDKQIITGPSYLQIEDIPIPVGIPFGFFPKANRRSSGILFPTFGEVNSSMEFKCFTVFS